MSNKRIKKKKKKKKQSTLIIKNPIKTKERTVNAVVGLVIARTNAK